MRLHIFPSYSSASRTSDRTPLGVEKDESLHAVPAGDKSRQWLKFYIENDLLSSHSGFRDFLGQRP